MGFKKNLLTKFNIFLHSLKFRHNPRILANSMPKAGTHLLTRFISFLPGMKGTSFIDIGPNLGIEEFTEKERARAEKFLRKIKNGFYGKSHCFYFDELVELLERYTIKCITIIRDPRDVCVSDYHYILKNKSHRLHQVYRQMASNDERCMASIVGLSSEYLNGEPPSLDIGTHYKNYIGWQGYSNGLVIKYEDLIGSKGCGSDDKQA
ncbi:MAG: hypothetical protein GTO02_04335, partial [Candidatus Dadabacteria bacterium]|nr:hypothetical protein [Candidatus Dadabacteria bacterium]